ncbi:hypothetical protein EGP64_00490 [bacterium]|nr:hypothetical protein [bacterium]
MKATKDFKKINILINGEESNRDEIIYNNLISNLNLTEEEQVKYLKRRAMTLEQEIKNQKLTLLLCFISLIGISFGVILLVQNIYFLGILFIITTFVGVILRFHLMYKNMIEDSKSHEFDRVEQLKSILEDRLK